jgi:hypothetical protein
MPYGDLAAAIPSTAGLDAIRALGYEPPAGSGGGSGSGSGAELSTWRKVASRNERNLSNDHDQQITATTLCWQMAYVQSISHALSRTSLHSADDLTAFLDPRSA